MAQVGGFLQALGQAFGGYAKDKQTAIDQQQAVAHLAMLQQDAQDRHLDAVLSRVTSYPFASGGDDTGGGSSSILPSAGGQPPGYAGPGAGGATAAAGLPPSFGLPTGRVDVPGYGTIDPFGKFRMGLTIDQLKKRQETDEAIRKSDLTGETAKNEHEAKRLQMGDPGYVEMMGQVAGSEAKARVPSDILKAVTEGKISLENGKALAAIRSGVELQLQKNQQQFETGKISQQQKFEQDQAAKSKEAEFFNRVGEMDYNARGSITGHILPRPPMPTEAPSAAVMSPTGPGAPPPDAPPTARPAALPQLTPAQKLRAARDSDYAAFLKAKGYP